MSFSERINKIEDNIRIINRGLNRLIESFNIMNKKLINLSISIENKIKPNKGYTCEDPKLDNMLNKLYDFKIVAKLENSNNQTEYNKLMSEIKNYKNEGTKMDDFINGLKEKYNHWKCKNCFTNNFDNKKCQSCGKCNNQNCHLCLNNSTC